MSASATLPLTVFGRSPFDPIRIRWSGVGNIVLGIACIGSTGGAAGGITFGIVFILLGLATWVVTRFGSLSWLSLTGFPKVLASIGAVIGVLFLYLLFFWLFIFFFVLKTILRWMSE